jgi:hypothetical protein
MKKTLLTTIGSSRTVMPAVVVRRGLRQFSATDFGISLTIKKAAGRASDTMSAAAIMIGMTVRMQASAFGHLA